MVCSSRRRRRRILRAEATARMSFGFLRRRTRASASSSARCAASSKAIWCDHPRRGRVDFHEGLPSIAHGLVTVETLRPVDLDAAALDLPLSKDGAPILYFSLSDFFNVALQLRTVPELMRYLHARKELPEAARRRLGDEPVSRSGAVIGKPPGQRVEAVCGKSRDLLRSACKIPPPHPLPEDRPNSPMNKTERCCLVEVKV